MLKLSSHFASGVLPSNFHATIFVRITHLSHTCYMQHPLKEINEENVVRHNGRRDMKKT
jgi:hypothetical protein